MASLEGLLLDPVYSAGRYAAGRMRPLHHDSREPRPLRLCEGFPRRGPQGFDLSNVLQPLATQWLETPQRVWEMPNIIVPEAIGEQS